MRLHAVTWAAAAGHFSPAHAQPLDRPPPHSTLDHLLTSVQLHLLQCFLILLLLLQGELLNDEAFQGGLQKTNQVCFELLRNSLTNYQVRAAKTKTFTDLVF